MSKKILIAGAGGFIGSHLVSHLKELGYWVRGVDLKHPKWSKTKADQFLLLDLRYWTDCLEACMGAEWVFDLAADMGGIGYIHSAHAEIACNNNLISTHMIKAARTCGVKRYLFSSSACIYPKFLQTEAGVRPLRESDAWPADPEDAYGLQKLMHEEMCRYYLEDFGFDVRVVRFHNIFGPLGTWEGGREKAPAALCRKIASAKLRGEKEIEVWGDGKQSRSFCYIDDCTRLLLLLMESNHQSPINIGTDRLVSIDELVDIISAIAEFPVEKKYNLAGVQGVRGRNADLTLMKKVLGEPRISLEEGLLNTYQWIEQQVKEKYA